MGCEAVRNRGVKRRLGLALACAIAAILAVSLAPGLSSSAYAETTPIVYSQQDGYEPYQGWQDSPWDEASDPWYASSGGTSRKGFPAWSLTDPLSKGVTGYDNGAVTGSTISVLTDMNKTDTSGSGTYSDPYYYKNIILPSYDANAATLQFTLTYVGAGGVNPVYLFDGHGGLLVTKSDDPASWSDPANVVWEGSASNVSVLGTSDNWWKNIVCTVDASNIDPDQTYYFVVKNGTAGQWARLYANIVFEFNTFTDKAAVWSGDESQAGYGREQGNGGTKLGIMSPSPSEVVTDLSKIGSCWFNKMRQPMTLADDGSVSMVIHADGSGSNWQLLNTWTGTCADKVLVYDSDPTAGGSFDASALTPVASAAGGTLGFSLVNPDRDWPSYDGVKITASGLEANKTYYLVFGADLQPQTTRSLGKPIVYEFVTAAPVTAIGSWDIGKETPSDATATLYSDGQLVIAGSGDLKTYDAVGKPPWCANAYKSEVKSVRFEGVSPADISNYFIQCNKLEVVASLPDTVTSLDQTFNGCSSLKDAPAIPENVENLHAAFGGCTSMVKPPRIPDGAENMEGMFVNCLSLDEAPELPEGVTSIASMFSGCGALSEAPSIPSSVTDMNNAFYGCASLEAMPTIPEGAVNLQNAFSGCVSLKAIAALPDSVENMSGAFNGCAALETAPVLPNGVKYITNIFNGCTSLKAAPEIPESVEESMFGSFQNCIAMETGPSKIPEGVTNMWRAFQNCRALEQAPELSEGVENMREAFSGCSSLKTAPAIPGSVTSLQSAFQNCSGITEAPLVPSSVTNMTSAFMNCTSLVRLPDGFAFPNTGLTNTFKVNDPYSPSNLLATYTTSKDESLSKYDWSGSNRLLVVQDFDALTAAVSGAESALETVAVSADGKDVANGSTYVASSDASALTNAIAAAKAVAEKADATQDEIDAAAQALGNARASFDAAVKTAVTDYDALKSSLAEAAAAKDAVVVSVDGNDVPAGRDWATQENVDQLQAVLDAQGAVASNTAATQNEVDAALQVVKSATAAFESSTNTANPSTVSLAAALSIARAAADGPAISTDGRDVPHGKTWCTSEDLQALENAIGASQDVVDAIASAAGNGVAADTSQAGVDASLAALNEALATFNAHVKTAAVDTTALSEAVKAGTEDLSATTVSVDGTDVLARNKWVTQGQFDAYEQALASARSELQDASRTQNGVDAALRDLATASSSFDDAKRAGLKADTSALASLVKEAREEVSAATVAAGPGEVASGAEFVTQGALDAYRAAIARAQAVLDDPLALQDEVDAATKDLIEAKAAFASAKQLGTFEQGGSETGSAGGASAGSPGSASGIKALASTGDAAMPVLAAGLAAVLACACFALIARRRLRG